MIAAPFALIRSLGHIYVFITNVHDTYVLVKIVYYSSCIAIMSNICDLSDTFTCTYYFIVKYIFVKNIIVLCVRGCIDGRLYIYPSVV